MQPFGDDERDELREQLQGLSQRESVDQLPDLSSAPLVERGVTLLVGDDVAPAELKSEFVRFLTGVTPELGEPSTTVLLAAFRQDPRFDQPLLRDRLATYAVLAEPDREKPLSDRQLRRRISTALDRLTDVFFVRSNRAAADSARRAARRRDPARSRIASSPWLRFFRHYYRMWSDASGITNDFAAFLKRREKDPADASLPQYLDSSLWNYALLLVHLRRFMEEEGGMWLLSDGAIEVRVSEDIVRSQWHAPVSEFELSWLRMTLAAVPEMELVPFLDAVAKDEVGHTVMTHWHNWVKRCRCDLESPDESCEVHIVIGLLEDYMKVIDDEWYKIADWYDRPPAQRPGHEDYLGRFERFPYRLNELDVPDA